MERNPRIKRNSKGKKKQQVVKKKQQVRKYRERSIVPQKQGLILSPCLIAYAKSKLDPFNFEGNELPCIPDLYDLPSQKVVSMIRGTATIGTTGFGFVMAAADWNSNGKYVVYASASNYASSNTPTSPTPAGITGYYDLRFPYDPNFYRNHRMVSSALRIRYTGTELNRGGQICMYVNNSDADSLNGVGMPYYTNIPETLKHPVERRWSTIGWNAGYASAFQYDNIDNALDIAAGNAKLQAILTGTAGNTYEWELIGYHEIISAGTYTVNATTKSHTDLPGMSILRDFISSETVSNIGTKAFQTFLGYAKSQAAQAAMSHFGSVNASMLRLQH